MFPAVSSGALVSGRIMEKGTEKPVAWAWITIHAVGSQDTPVLQNIITDKDGSFVTGKLAAGKYVLNVSHISFRSPSDIPIDISEGRDLNINLDLVSRLFEQQSVVIKAARIRKRGGMERVTTREELESTPGAFEDPLRVLAAAPGVETRSDIDGRLSFRGGNPAEAGYSLDGIPIPVAYHLGGLTSIFHPGAVKKMHSYASGHPASLGPGTAGYVEVESSGGFAPSARSSGRPDKYRTGGRLEASPITLGGVFERSGAREKWNTTVSFRRTYHDLILGALGKTEGITVPNFFDGQAQSSWHFKDGQAITLSLLRSGDRAVTGLTGLAADDGSDKISLSGDLMRIAAGWNCVWKGENDGEAGAGVSLAYQPYEYDMRVSGLDTESMDWDAQARIASANLYWRLQNHCFEAGALIIDKETSYSVSIARGFWKLWSGPPTESSLEGDPVTLSARGSKNTGYDAFYMQDKWSLFSGRISITGGARMEYFAASKEKSLSPRFAIEYFPGSISIHGAWGVYRSHPLDHPGDPSTTAENLRTSISEHAALGITSPLGSMSSFDIDIYSRKTRRLIAEIAPGSFASEAQGRAYGIDAEWSHAGRRFNFAAAYSYGRSLRLDPNGPLLKTAEMDANGAYQISWAHGPDGWYAGAYDPGHGFTIRAGTELAGSMHLRILWSYRSGRPVTPVAKTVEDGPGRVFGIEGVPGSVRLSDYHRLDVRLDRNFQTRWGILSAYVEVANLYNHPNVFQSNFNRDYTSQNRFLSLPILPTAGMVLVF